MFKDSGCILFWRGFRAEGVGVRQKMYSSKLRPTAPTSTNEAPRGFGQAVASKNKPAATVPSRQPEATERPAGRRQAIRGFVRRLSWRSEFSMVPLRSGRSLGQKDM